MAFWRYLPHSIRESPEHHRLGSTFRAATLTYSSFAPDMHEFTHAVWCAFSDAPGFVAKQWANPPRSMVVSFEAAGWKIEVYGEAIPVEQRRGWRHFIVEQRLLTLGGNGFRTAVLTLRLPGFELTVSRRKTIGGLAWLAPGDVPINESYEALTTPRLHAVRDVRSVWLSNT